MRKVIAALNMTIDGFCDHTGMIADEETHQYYADMMRNAGAVLFGRVTYQLMEFWKGIVQEPTGDAGMDNFGVAIENAKKIVFSRTLKEVDWANTELKREINKDDILELKHQAGNDIYVGSPSLIVALTELDVIDEYHLAIQPTILGSGLPLFKNITQRVDLHLTDTKTFECGVIVLFYKTK